MEAASEKQGKHHAMERSRAEGRFTPLNGFVMAVPPRVSKKPAVLQLPGWFVCSLVFF